jgi:hypothetical protein
MLLVDEGDGVAAVTDTDMPVLTRLPPPHRVHEPSGMLVLVLRRVLSRPDPAASPHSAQSDHEAGHARKGGQAAGARPA